MADPALLALASVLVVSVLSFTGATLLTLRALRHHLILLVLVAFAAGSLLGDAFFHLIPEAVEAFEAFEGPVALLVVGGFLLFFLLEAVLRWTHAHGAFAHHGDDPTHPAPATGKVAPYAVMNLISDGVHNFIDGALIATTYLVSPTLGVATTIAVAAHEIPQELGDFAVLVKGGFEVRRALMYNFLSALFAVVGAGLVLVLPVDVGLLEVYVLPAVAGGFLYIAASDLVPELHHHAHSRYVPVILLGLLGGLAVMWALLGLE